MKVLHVYRTYYPDPPGGLQEAIRQICLAVQEHGVENTIFTLSPRPEPAVIRRPEAVVVRSRSWAAPASCDLGGIDALTCYRRLAAQADVIHLLFPWPFADLLQLVTRADKPVVVTYISDIVRQRQMGRLYAPLLRRTLAGASAIVTSSPAYARTSPVLSSASVRDKVQVIPLGIRESDALQHGDDGVFQRLGRDPGLPFFLFVGVLRYYKGLEFLIEAARQVKAPIVIAGSGAEEETLRRLVAHKKVDNILFASQVSEGEKASLLRHCRGLILPSHLRSEAFGMVLVEAAMAGKPMISCDIGTGTSWINQHGKTGYVVEPGCPDALAVAMNKLLTDAEQARIMGQAARQRYETLYSGNITGQLYADLYKELTKL